MSRALDRSQAGRKGIVIPSYRTAMDSSVIWIRLTVPKPPAATPPMPAACPWGADAIHLEPWERE